MAQVIRCDVCGKTADAQAAQEWGNVFRPIAHAIPTADLAEAKKNAKKDLCPGCSYALEQVLDELRRRLQSRITTVSTNDRDEVLASLLTIGEEKP